MNITATGDFGVVTGSDSVTMETTHTGVLDYEVSTTGDGISEADGSVTVSIQPGAGYTLNNTRSSATAVVNDDDTPEINIAADDDFVIEGSGASFTITADPTPHQSLPVTLDIASTGQYGVSAGSRTVNIPTSGSATFSVDTSGDSTYEADGSVTATIQSGNDYTVGSNSSASVDVADDDGPVLTITNGGDVTEGQTVSFTIRASKTATGPMTVNLLVEGSGQYGVAPLGSQTIIVPSHGTKVITYYPGDDNIDEADGFATLTLKPGRGYTVGDPDTSTVNIADNDTLPTDAPEITITPDGDITEGGKLSFTVHADPAPANPITVRLRYRKADGGGDHRYPGIPQILTVSGATTIASTTVPNNDKDENDSVITATVQAGEGYLLGDPSTASVTIADDDVPTVEVKRWGTSAGSIIFEDGTSTFSIIVNNPLPYKKAVTVSLDVTSTGDFGVTGTREVTVPANQASASFTISPEDDNVDEPDGTITVTLNQSDDYDIGDDSSASVTVKDNDAPSGAKVSIRVAEPWKTTPGNTLDFNVTLSEPVANEVSMNFLMAPLHPSKLWAGMDFWDDNNPKKTSGRLVIPAGETKGVITVRIAQNAWYDEHDRFYVVISSLSGAGSFERSMDTGRVVTSLDTP